MTTRMAWIILPLLLLGLLLGGCGSGKQNLWDSEDEIFFFHGLKDGDTNVPINAVFGFKPSKPVRWMALYDSTGGEVASEIHQDNEGHWYLSPASFLATYSWYKLVIAFEDDTTIVVNFRTGGELAVNATPTAGAPRHVGLLINQTGNK